METEDWDWDKLTSPAPLSPPAIAEVPTSNDVNTVGHEQSDTEEPTQHESPQLVQIKERRSSRKKKANHDSPELVENVVIFYGLGTMSWAVFQVVSPTQLAF